ncbi:MAG: hypothetical protein GX189_09885 [Clostridiales bacterium]|nr:hypothetical protein [Clostridiales bacterium]
MKCPYCQKELEPGLIQSPREIAWVKGKNGHFFGSADLYEGSVVLSAFSFIRGSAVKAFLCRDCRKVIIDYAEMGSDLNARENLKMAEILKTLRFVRAGEKYVITAVKRCRIATMPV